MISGLGIGSSANALTKTGGGLLQIDTPSGYTGTTRVHGGTLCTTASGAD